MRQCGHCRVSWDFVVASSTGTAESEASEWPRHLHGYKLGGAENALHTGHLKTQVAVSSDALRMLGFGWNDNDFKWDEKIIPALR